MGVISNSCRRTCTGSLDFLCVCFFSNTTACPSKLRELLAQPLEQQVYKSLSRALHRTIACSRVFSFLLSVSCASVVLTSSLWACWDVLFPLTPRAISTFSWLEPVCTWMHRMNESRIWGLRWFSNTWWRQSCPCADCVWESAAEGKGGGKHKAVCGRCCILWNITVF